MPSRGTSSWPLPGHRSRVRKWTPELSVKGQSELVMRRGVNSEGAGWQQGRPGRGVA